MQKQGREAEESGHVAKASWGTARTIVRERHAQNASRMPRNEPGHNKGIKVG